MRKLQLVSGPAVGQELEIDRDLVIGREDADVVIPDDEISRRHVILRPVERGVEVEDLGSTNGTYLDRGKVSGPTPVPLGVPIRIGRTSLELRP